MICPLADIRERGHRGKTDALDDSAYADPDSVFAERWRGPWPSTGWTNLRHSRRQLTLRCAGPVSPTFILLGVTPLEGPELGHRVIDLATLMHGTKSC